MATTTRTAPAPDATPATLATAKKLGLLPEEFDKIKEILGRAPNFTELSIYSAMWSEHCSYKNSIRLLKTLPRTGQKFSAMAGLVPSRSRATTIRAPLNHTRVRPRVWVE